MSALSYLIEQDPITSRVYETLSYVRHRRATRTGFVNICCPMCVLRGQSRADRFFRCGIANSDGGIVIKCFNCNFIAKWRPGDFLGAGMQQFLRSLGVSSQDIRKMAYWASSVHAMIGLQPDLQIAVRPIKPNFPTICLPEDARTISEWLAAGCDDPDFSMVADHLYQRGEVICRAMTYYWAPSVGQYLLIPCHHEDRLVGWIGRAIRDDVVPRYWKEVPSHYLFNSQFLAIPERRYVLIVEGAFDALAIDAVGALGSSLTNIQIAWIKQSGKQPIVVADRDEAGEKLAEVAIEHGWAVATMHYGGRGDDRYAAQANRWWGAEIKDADEAVRHYGRLYVLRSILANLTFHKGLIRQRTQFRSPS